MSAAATAVDVGSAACLAKAVRLLQGVGVLGVPAKYEHTDRSSRALFCLLIRQHAQAVIYQKPVPCDVPSGSMLQECLTAATPPDGIVMVAFLLLTQLLQYSATHRYLKPYPAND